MSEVNTSQKERFLREVEQKLLHRELDARRLEGGLIHIKWNGQPLCSVDRDGSINGCSTKGAGSLTLVDGAFPAIAAEKNLAIRYKAKVSASEAVTNINAATIVFTIAAVNEKEAA